MQTTETLARFYGVDYRSLALFRCGVAIATILYLLVRIPDIGPMFTDAGCVPRGAAHVLAAPTADFSIYQLAGNAELVAILFGLQLIFALMLMVGYHTRLVSVLSWLFMVFLQNRNPLVVGGLDTVLRLMLLWGMFLPWGTYFSVDARRKGASPPVESTVCSIGTVAYIVQIQLIYLCTFVHKIGAREWLDGSAVLYSLNVDFITTQFGVYLTHFPRILRVLTPLTLVLEAAAPILLILPSFNGWLRTIAVVALMGLHLSFVFTFRLGLFPLINCVSLLPFIPSQAWTFLQEKAKTTTANRHWQSIRSAFDRLSLIEPVWHWPAPLNRAVELLSRGLCAVVLALVVFWNLATLPTLQLRVPGVVQCLADIIRIDQNWYMFARFDPPLNGWYVMPGLLANGETVDIFRAGAPLSWRRPQYIPADYASDRWALYLVQLFPRHSLGWRPYYAEFLARQWNDTHPVGEKLKELSIFYMYEGALPEVEPQDRESPVRLLVWQQKF